MKYILVSGGVISGVGKGIIASSTGLLLKTRGLRVTSIKIDPYMNVDAGTMSPTEHGEVYVLDDGGEVDLDLGNYERYLNISLSHEHKHNNRKDLPTHWIERVAKIPVDESGEEPHVCIVELGGTIGDVESGVFFEAMRQLQRRAGKGNFLQIHVSYVPVIPPGSGEQKTKPTQRAISDVRSAGLSPDLIACRCERPLEGQTIVKIANACQVDRDQVLTVHNVSTTYHVPVLLENQGVLSTINRILQLDAIQIPKLLLEKGTTTWTEWKSLASSQDHTQVTVSIALVGKYTSLHDSYMSVSKSLEHAAMHCKRKINLIWVDASHLEETTQECSPAEFHKAWHAVCMADGILVPGGFGHRGTEGMIKAAKWARTNNIPYLGICLGMQLAVIEYARNVCGIDAGSEEFDENHSNPAIVYMPEINKEKMGGTMRLGKRPTIFQPGTDWSRLRKLYGGTPAIWERHRHRYEVNPQMVETLEKAGLTFIGKDDKGERMEIVELRDHKWYVGVQFHPEYLSRVLAPSKTFLGFFAAAAACLEEISETYKDRYDLSHQKMDLNLIPGR
ncbi:CTP synthase [Paracoccidioides brasiliensis Pb03]|nr:CTP synthase [Paracoccidioides brasiliensis Pb03]